MWVRQDKRTVLRRREAGAQIQTVAPESDGALEELVALSIELKTFEMLDGLPIKRDRAGIPDLLLLHTLAVLPFLADGSLNGSAPSLFAEPAILIQLGYAPVQLRQGGIGPPSASRRQDRGAGAAAPGHPSLRSGQAGCWSAIPGGELGRRPG